MRGAGYLSSARTYTLVMLLAAYLGIDLARSYSKRVSLLLSARRNLAEAYILQNYIEKHIQGSILTEDVGGIGQVQILEVLPPRGGGSLLEDRVPGGGQKADKRKFLFSVVRPDRRRWAMEITERKDDPALPLWGESRRSPMTLESSIAMLKKIALDAGLNRPEKEDYVQTFRSIEFALAEQQVKVPGLELAARTDVAPWVIGVLIVGLMVQVRNQVRRVFLDETLALDEPWLVLDADGRLEKLVAFGWVAAIFLAPWLAVAGIVLVVTGKIIADGAITPWYHDALTSGGIILLMAVGGWLSLSVVAELLRLRRMRRRKLSELTSSNPGPAAQG